MSEKKTGLVLKLKTEEAMQLVQIAANGRLQEFAETIVELAKRPPGDGGSPVLTGNNRDSIDMGVTNAGKSGKVFRVFTESGYGAYLELGTSRMPPRPYIMRAFNDARRDFLD